MSEVINENSTSAFNYWGDFTPILHSKNNNIAAQKRRDQNFNKIPPSFKPGDPTAKS